MTTRPTLEWCAASGLRFLTDEQLLADCGIRVAFTTRLGGVSSPPYESLNLAFHVGDDASSVLANRRRVCLATGVDLESLTSAQQVHGTAVGVVGESEVGRGRDSYESAIPSTDALATGLRGAALALFFADCVPVVVADPANRAVGAAHAGWKGVLGNVAGALVSRMAESFGSEPSSLLAYVGPAIGPCHYEVDAERAALFARGYPDFVHSDAARLDLQYLVRKSLDAAGLPLENVAAADMCTADNTDLFYSYRSEGGETGRHAAIVSILP